MLPRATRARSLVRIGGDAFGTRWRVLIPADVDRDGLQRDLDRLLGSLDAVLSPFRTDSELGHVNRAGPRITL